MKYKVDVPLWTDVQVIIEASNKKEAMKLATAKLSKQNKPIEMNDLLFDYNRFTGGCLYNHTINDFVKEMKKEKAE